MSEKKKLLYVDDEVANLNVFRIAFKRKYDVTTAGSAEEGMELLANEKYDIIVCDHRMPGMTGVEMLAKVSDEYPHMIRIIISEYINDEIIRHAMKSYNLDGSMGKPWDAGELIAIIEGQ
ncbi:response regulator [Reichenbachiella agarivorans]|uniref:Response regulator n=1 Tax=Reichenbachiella agarivorans TaxID=2979464 RepID=A0ABY6CPW4_9BACT|nr:response regulator [Reichenbachiella agarivorans]UXP32557.1 response regulator [Reichenbachiella agarivorans]